MAGVKNLVWIAIFLTVFGKSGSQTTPGSNFRLRMFVELLQNLQTSVNRLVGEYNVAVGQIKAEFATLEQNSVSLAARVNRMEQKIEVALNATLAAGAAINETAGSLNTLAPAATSVTALGNNIRGSNVATTVPSPPVTTVNMMATNTVTTTGSNITSSATGNSTGGSNAANASTMANATTGRTFPIDCNDVMLPFTLTEVKPQPTSAPKEVLCDRGWLVIQMKEARTNPNATDFRQNWETYAQGFGTVNETDDFWIGNRFINDVTGGRNYTLQVHMVTAAGAAQVTTFDFFRIGPESGNFVLTVSGPQGTGGDALTYHSGSPFSTFDRDNDGYREANCANKSNSGWWFNACALSDLNRRSRMYWFGANALTEVQKSVMKIRRN